eukprot:TRINITY_DN20035_c0_g1_i1.p1 TRINITY_DN20035_c0_g1~~TRINITY_DN20035_c0_g1_i1.p1  ORF type:complete len:316 (+),score=38.08 TRINITY_DN20035_c0_g1_i1:62-1009(+)
MHRSGFNRTAAAFAAGAFVGVGALRLLASIGGQEALVRGWFTNRRVLLRRGAGSALQAHGRFAQQVTFIYVRDLQQGTDFYGGVLGLRPVLDQTPPGEAAPVVRIFEVTPSAYIGLCERDPASLASTWVSPDGVVLCLVSDEVDQWAEHLTKAGIVIEKAPTLNPRYNIYHLFVRDPDGHLVEIQQFRDPAWPQAPLAFSDGLLIVTKGQAAACDHWPIWSCPALPDPAGRFQESRWWESRPGVAEERCLILTGKAVLTTPDGHKTVIEAGDWVVFRKGFTCLWEVKDAISKRYGYFCPDGTEYTDPSAAAALAE